MSTFSRMYKTIHFLRSPRPAKKSTHQHFLSAKNPLENNINEPQKLKVYGKMLIFTDPPPSRPHRKCMFCTLLKMLKFLDGPYITYIQ